MSSELHFLEESLKEFLILSQDDSYNTGGAGTHKYNNLKIFMNPSQNKTPHFIVRIGISEAMYKISNCEKLSGGIGGEEKYVRRWLDKSFIKSDIEEAWNQNSKTKQITLTEEID